MVEAVPDRVACKPVGKLRDDVEIPQENAIKRSRCSDKAGTILGEDDFVDQFIHGGVLDADGVFRARLVRALRAPEFPLLVAGRQRLSPYVGDDVEVEVTQPVLVLRIVHDADRRRHADTLERRLVKQR
jgi:hypothetical protein